jgi:glycosyltransferase involved in cell wall biosynthesis
VDPTDIASIAQALRDLTEREDLRQELAQRGTARARLFTWEKAVRETWAIYRELA